MCTCGHVHNSSKTLTVNSIGPIRPSKVDPTRTLTLRNRFRQDVRGRFARVARAVRDLVDSQDVFGLRDRRPLRLDNLQSRPTANVAARGWEFKKDADKIASFRSWLQKEVGTQILDEGDPVWTHEYIDSAYRQGLVRAYTDANSLGSVDASDYYTGRKDEFIRSAFAAPETRAKLEAIYTRSYSSLQGVTSTMDTQLSRVLSQGLLDGTNPRDIAREMTSTIGKLSRTRAETIARTEIIFAHAEGQLDSFDKLGIKELGVMAEWSTAGDDRVCPECAEMAGKTYTVDEAHGLIPFHPNCRCTWTPSVAQEIPDEPEEDEEVWGGEGHLAQDERELLRTSGLSAEEEKTLLSQLKDAGVVVKEGLSEASIASAEAIAQFQSQFRMSPIQFRRHLLKGLPPELQTGRTLVELRPTGRWTISHYNPVFNMRRYYDPKLRSVVNDSLEITKAAQGKAHAKTLLRNQVQLWDHLGVTRMELFANVDVGGYAWARYGYLPDADDWGLLKRRITLQRTRAEASGVSFSPSSVKVMDAVLGSEDPRGVWALAGLKDSVDGIPLGKHLLLKSMWNGSLDLSKGSVQRKIFTDYIGGGPRG